MRRALRWVRKIGLALTLLMAGLFVAASLLRSPPDLSLQAKEGDSETIYVLDHGYHASVVLSVAVLAERARALNLPNIAAALQHFDRFVWVEIGWGDEGFYRNVPALSFSAMPHVLRALFLPGNKSVLHVVGFDRKPEAVFSQSDALVVKISREGFDRMAGALDRSFLVETQGSPVFLGAGLYGPSAFFAAREKYHLLNVCNHWLARLLAVAGLSHAPIEATLSGGLMYDLRRQSDVKLPSKSFW